MDTESTSQQEKQITIEVPEARVAEFYAFYARFLANAGGRGRGGPRGHRHEYGHGRPHGRGPESGRPHGHGHGCGKRSQPEPATTIV